jgi:tetratricopeptide (TPR) repeat protein
MAASKKRDPEAAEDQPASEEQSQATADQEEAQEFEVERRARQRVTRSTDEPQGPLERILEYRKVIGGAVTAVVIVIAGLVFYNQYQKEQEKEASAEAFRALDFYRKDSVQRALQSAGTGRGLPAIADAYGGTKVGNLAKYLAGAGYLEQGKTEQAIAYLEDFERGETLISAAATAALATAYEDQEQFKKAAETFQEAANTQANKHTSPHFLMEAARAWELAGNQEKALKTYQKVLNQYPDPGGNQEQEVNKHIARLKAATGAYGASTEG